MDKSTYAPSPPPSLTSSSCSTLVENKDVAPTTGIQLGSDTDDDLDSVSSDASEDSSYPPPYCNPTSYTTAIGRVEGYNLPHNTIFNPAEVCTSSTTHFTPIRFLDGCFDGTGRDSLINCPITTGFIPALEYNQDYTPMPFSGTFSSNYLEPATFYTTCLYTNAKRCLDNITSISSKCELMAKYPVPIYFRRTSGYELHVYRGHTRYGTNLPELQKLRADALNLMHALHVVLTPHQAAECLDDDIQVYFIDGNTCTSVYLN